MATESDIREALRHVLDPEIGINIVDLGLVYRIETEGTRARIAMTMTSPACPLAEYLKDLITSAVRQHVPSVTDIEIVVEWEPPWDPEMMSDEAAAQTSDRHRASPQLSRRRRQPRCGYLGFHSHRYDLASEQIPVRRSCVARSAFSRRSQSITRAAAGGSRSMRYWRRCANDSVRKFSCCRCARRYRRTSKLSLMRLGSGMCAPAVKHRLPRSLCRNASDGQLPHSSNEDGCTPCKSADSVQRRLPTELVWHDVISLPPLAYPSPAHVRGPAGLLGRSCAFCSRERTSCPRFERMSGRAQSRRML